MMTTPCTGIAASWCPVHGDCTCPRAPDGERLNPWDDELSAAGCPLHGEASDHCELALQQAGIAPPAYSENAREP